MNYINQKLAKNWFHLLSDNLCYEYEKMELDFAKRSRKKPKKFEDREWKKADKDNDEGGGNSRIIRDGLIFEKIGVNFSEVWGKFDNKFKNKIPGTDKKNSYYATGISVVIHTKNPKIPAMHFNTRFISTSKSWFGGGMDMTPCINDKKENLYFHNSIKKMCEMHDKNYYKKYKAWCDKYFYLKHRQEPRGVGGIFFDYKNNNWKKDFNFVRDAGLCFLNVSSKIIRNKMFYSWKKKEKEKQLLKRGKYVEFNLLYDRGTKFGLETRGNTDAILMSLPPLVKWK